MTFAGELDRRRRREVLPRHGWKRAPEKADGKSDGTFGGDELVLVSLDDLEVVQDGHDVLRHEDVAGVNGHAGH